MLPTDHRLRKLHLDFHNSPLISDLGELFDSDDFAKTLSDALVDYVVCFAKCHHGMCYYDTQHGVKHPALTFDLLERQIEACHRRDIAVSAYLSVVWEEEAARQHPEWQQLGPDGRPRHQIPGNGWATVCLNSPYIEEMLLPQVHEVVSRYDVDGMWFDMIHLDENACYCRWCLEKIACLGLSYEKPEEAFAFTAASVYQFLDRCSLLIRSVKPDVDIEYNSQLRFNPRGALPSITGFEIECTPSERGTMYFPMFARHARLFGKIIRGVTPRFHRIWADFGSVKNSVQLQWETATMLAAGGGCSIGDQMHPRGELEPLVYNRIGKTYAAVAAREPWCRDAQAVTEAAILVDDDLTDFGIAKASDAVWGATRMLIECQMQFDIIDARCDLNAYRLLILPDNRRLSGDAMAAVNRFIAAGGRALATYRAGWDTDAKHFGLEALPLQWNDFTPTGCNYVQRAESLRDDEPLAAEVIRYPFLQVEPPPDAHILAHTLLPYFDRTPQHFTSHHQAPPDRPGQFPAIVRLNNVIYCAAPIFAAYHRDGDSHCRHIIVRCLESLLPDRLLRLDPAWPMVEASIMRQSGRHIVHLVNYAAGKRGQAPENIEAIPPLFDLGISCRLPSAPQCAYLAPDKEPLPITVDDDGVVHCRLPRLDIHAMIVFEEQ